MDYIRVQLANRTQDSGTYRVLVTDDSGSREFSVRLTDAYWEALTLKLNTPEWLIKKSFEFLLERESKEYILGYFDLTEISRYFPEYESQIS